jgi:hypothetical protein
MVDSRKNPCPLLLAAMMNRYPMLALSHTGATGREWTYKESPTNEPARLGAKPELSPCFSAGNREIFQKNREAIEDKRQSP